MIKRIINIKNWLFNKVPEITSLSQSDALLAKIVLKIKQEAQNREFRKVDLNSVKLIHPIKRESAIEKLNERIDSVNKNKEKISANKFITNKALIEIMPSVSPVQVIPYKGDFLAFEGNGRVLALQKVFKENILIEVEVFSIPENSTIYSDLETLKKLFYTKLDFF